MQNHSHLMGFVQFRVNSPQAVREVNDEETAVILVENGCCYSLDRIGAEVWRLIGEGADADAIVALMTRRYKAPAGEVHEAIELLLGQLEEEGLITPAEAEGACPIAGPSGDPLPWTPPKLSKLAGGKDVLRPLTPRAGLLPS